MQKCRSTKANGKPPLYLVGESLVCNFLKKKGYVILKQNFRKIGCEIDIVAKKELELVFVEVKTRACEHIGKFGYHFERLLSTPKKRAIARGVMHYLAENDLAYTSIRIDLVLALYDHSSDTFAISHFRDIDIAE